MIQPIEKMGNYIKSLDAELINEKEITALKFDKEVTIEEALDWATKSNFNVKSGELDSNENTFQLSNPLPITVLKKTTVQINDKVKAVCQKIANPHIIEFDKKIFKVKEKVEKWLEINGLKHLLIADVADKVKVTIREVNDISNQRKRTIEKGVTFLYLDNLPEQKEECKMPKVAAIKQKRFMCHAELKVANEAGSDDFFIEGLASTGEIDRDFDIVSPKAFEKALDTYMENAVICYMHDWDKPIWCSNIYKDIKSR